MPALSLAFMAKYKKDHRVFVETGTYLCETVENALQAGFHQVLTVELDRKMFDDAFLKYQHNNTVKIWHADSGEALGRMLSGVKEPAFIFLDAHYCGIGSKTAIADVWIPVKKELEHLANHPIKTHTVIIDDMEAMDNVHFDEASQKWTGGPTVTGVVERLKKINPAYKIHLDQQTDRIVATI